MCVTLMLPGLSLILYPVQGLLMQKIELLAFLKEPESLEVKIDRKL